MNPYHTAQHPYYPIPSYVSNDFPQNVFYNGRNYTRKPLFVRPAVWIERGPNGRPYYVRKRTELPSLRRILSQATHDLRSNLSNRRYSDSVVSVPSSHTANASTPSQTRLQTPNPNTKKTKSKTIPENIDPPSQFVHTLPSGYLVPMPPFTHQEPFRSNTVPLEEPSDRRQNTQALPAAQPFHYAAPHPRMWPVPPPAGQNYLTLHDPTNVNAAPTYSASATPASLPYPPQAAPPFPPHSNPNAIQLMQGTTFPSPDDRKYKCSVCGRYRSARYHWKHPLPPGATAGPTICRTCREDATDSEDESTDSYEERDYRRRSRTRRRSRSASVRPKSRARSSSHRGRKQEDFDYYQKRHKDRSSSESSSDDLIQMKRKARSRRERSPSVEIIRYVDAEASRPKTKRKMVIYVEDRRRHEQESEDEGGSEVHYISYPRRGTPAPYHLERRLSDPQLQSSNRTTRREYFDGSPPADTFRLFSQPLHLRSRSQSNPNRALAMSNVEVYEEPYRGEGRARFSQQRDLDYQDRYIRGRSVEPRGYHGGRDNSTGDQGVGSRNHRPWISRDAIAASPRRHSSRSSSLDYVDSADAEAVPRSQRSSSHQRRIVQPRSRARQDYQHYSEASETPRDGQDRYPMTDDYDWYDKDGMRVRVREI